MWLPPKVSRELVQERARRSADILLEGRTDEICRQFNRELRLIDPYLEMLFFGADCRVQGAVPSRYHLSRRSPDAPATLIAITGPNGEFVEPSSAIFAKLAEGDLWSSNAVRERERMVREAERARDRKRAREAEERQEEIKDRMNAAFRTQVGWDPKWTQNVAGKRGARA